MTDLTKAIAEDGWQPIETAPRDGSWFYAKAVFEDYPYDTSKTRVVHFDDAYDRFPIHDGMSPWPRPPTHWKPLNVALSGDLIPATERDAAVAAALEGAINAIDGANGHNDAAERRCKEAIRALITQPQADALARVRAEAVSAELAESRAYALALEQELRDRQAVAAPKMSESDFDCLILDAMAEAMKAMRKYPQPNYVISKVAEEAGEVVKAAIHCAEGRETAENLRGEMKQLIAMLYRLWIEGDQVHGLPPVSARIRAAIGGVE